MVQIGRLELHRDEIAVVFISFFTYGLGVFTGLLNSFIPILEGDLTLLKLLKATFYILGISSVAIVTLVFTWRIAVSDKFRSLEERVEELENKATSRYDPDDVSKIRNTTSSSEIEIDE